MALEPKETSGDDISHSGQTMDSLHEKVSSLPNNTKETLCEVCSNKAVRVCSLCKDVAYCCLDHQMEDKENHLKVCQSTLKQKETKQMEDMECPICQEKATKTCSACKSVAYCCVDHQRLDWKNHKKVCQAFSIKETEDMGMGWFATRDLPAGFILLEESPVIQGPAWKIVPDSIESRKCLACGIKIKSTRTCSTCSWPVCSDKCEKNPLHMDNECKEIVIRKVKFLFYPSWQIGMLTICMRANALKARDPTKFEQLMALQDFHSISSSSQNVHEIDLPPGMFDVLSGPNCLDRDEFRKLLRICQVNCSKGYNPPVMDRILDVSRDFNFFIYLKASRLNHSCSPNSTFDFGLSPTFQIRIRTTVPVTKGEDLTINYYDVLSFKPVSFRQPFFKGQGFICKCKRCLDPTELGTFLSGIKCFNCSSNLRADCDPTGEMVGFLLPANPLDIGSPDPEFECHRCHVKVPFSKVQATLPAIVQQAFLNINKWITPVQENSFENLMKIYEGSGDFKYNLHPNHWIRQAAIRSVIKNYNGSFSAMTMAELERIVSRLEFLWTVDRKLYPGLLGGPLYDDSLMLTMATSMLTFKYSKQLGRDGLQKWLKIGVQGEDVKSKFLQYSYVDVSSEMELPILVSAAATDPVPVQLPSSTLEPNLAPVLASTSEKNIITTSPRVKVKNLTIGLDSLPANAPLKSNSTKSSSVKPRTSLLSSKRKKPSSSQNNQTRTKSKKLPVPVNLTESEDDTTGEDAEENGNKIAAKEPASSTKTKDAKDKDKNEEGKDKKLVITNFKLVNQKRAVTNSMMIDTGEYQNIRKANQKIYACKVCGIKGPFGDLKAHTKKHAGSKMPFECSFCKKKFNVKRSFDDHIRTHTGERPFECTICKRKFVSTNGLSAHRATHLNNKKAVFWVQTKPGVVERKIRSTRTTSKWSIDLSSSRQMPKNQKQVANGNEGADLQSKRTRNTAASNKKKRKSVEEEEEEDKAEEEHEPPVTQAKKTRKTSAITEVPHRTKARVEEEEDNEGDEEPQKERTQPRIRPIHGKVAESTQVVSTSSKSSTSSTTTKSTKSKNKKKSIESSPEPKNDDESSDNNSDVDEELLKYPCNINREDGRPHAVLFRPTYDNSALREEFIREGLHQLWVTTNKGSNGTRRRAYACGNKDHPRYTTELRAMEHIRMDHLHLNNSYRCLVSSCGKLITRNGELEVHRKFHAGQVYPCVPCGKVYQLESSLVTHLRRRHAPVGLTKEVWVYNLTSRAFERYQGDVNQLDPTDLWRQYVTQYKDREDGILPKRLFIAGFSSLEDVVATIKGDFIANEKANQDDELMSCVTRFSLADGFDPDYDQVYITDFYIFGRQKANWVKSHVREEVDADCLMINKDGLAAVKRSPELLKRLDNFMDKNKFRQKLSIHRKKYDEQQQNLNNSKNKQ